MRVTERDVQRFTFGDCYWLAEALHRRTGWPVCAFADSGDGDPDLHCWVRTPDGRALDVCGAQPMEEFVAAWQEGWVFRTGEHREYPLEAVKRTLGRFPPKFGRGTHGRAGKVAKALLEAL